MYDNGLIRFLRNAYWLQDLVVRTATAVHPGMEHYWAKIAALKKAFFFVNLDDVPGDYVEFGVFQGTSFVSALRAHLITRTNAAQARTFWGFDSFQGLRYTSEGDRHPSWTEGEFKADYERTRRRIARRFGSKAAWQLVPGFFEDTIANQTAPHRGIHKAAVVLIDCDLRQPAWIALEFVEPALQEGSIVLFDEFLGYGGSREKGEAAAFEEFRRNHPNLVFRSAFEYGLGGRGFILASRSGQK